MRVAVLWALVGGFLIGVFARSFLAFGWWTVLFFIVAAAAVLVTGFLARASMQKTVIVAAALCAIAAGGARMHVAAFSGDVALDVWVGERVVIEGVVSDEPDGRENNVRLPVRVTNVASTSVSSGVKVLVVAPLHTDAKYGDIVRAEGELRLPEAFDAGAGREFNYPAFLAKDGVGYELSFAQVRVIGEGDRNPLKAAAIWIKQMYLDGLAQSLSEPEAGLAGGITAGDKRGLGSELSETFRVVGLIHIVVLSGYNIMVVIQFLEWLLGSTRLWIRSSIAVVVAVFFALITGLASSSVRAASMAVIATAGKASGRTYLASRALAVVAVGMVLWNPFVLAFDPGFQLSIIATLGLIYISPLFAERLTWVTERFGLREIAAATLGTQAAVLPLILFQSGSLSLYSLPANLLALVVVPWAMLLSFIAGVAGTFLGPVAPVVGFPAYLLLWYVTHVAEFFAWLPFSAVTIPAFSAVWLVVFYALLVAVVASIQKKTATPR
jgi:competence protein ComEC